jgi:hypothetical protein
MEPIQTVEHPGFTSWGYIIAEHPYIIVLDKKKGEYTASTKSNDKTIYILDYGEGTKTMDEAKEAVMAYHRKLLS